MVVPFSDGGRQDVFVVASSSFLFNLCSLGSVMQLVLSIAFRGIYTETPSYLQIGSGKWGWRYRCRCIYTETPSYLQIVDNGIAAHDADKGIILYHGQLIHIATCH